MKFCIDCKHSARPGRFKVDYRCYAPAVAIHDVSPVYGPVRGAVLCRDARAFSGNCGPDARHFEPVLRLRLKAWLISLGERLDMDRLK